MDGVRAPRGAENGHATLPILRQSRPLQKSQPSRMPGHPGRDRPDLANVDETKAPWSVSVETLYIATCTAALTLFAFLWIFA